MKFSEFTTQIERLKTVYGANKYPDERVAIIFERMGGLPVDSFENQISTFIAEREKAPLLGDFVEAFAGQMNDLKLRAIEKKLENQPDCSACSNSGVIICYDKNSCNSYAFQCDCIRGGLLNPAYPKKFKGIEEIFVSHRQWVSGKFEKKRQPNNTIKMVAGMKTFSNPLGVV